MNGPMRRQHPLPHLSYLVLLALAEGEAHGWAVIKRIEALTEGQTRPSSGSLYLAMTRLEDRGLLEEIDPPGEESGGPPRKYYRLSASGRRACEAESARLSALVRHARRFHLLGGPARPADGGL